MTNYIEKVEDFIYSVYLENCDSHKEEIKCPLDKKTYIVDGAKLQSLNSRGDFKLNKCYIGKSEIKTAGDGLFAKNDILKDELITFYPGISVETYSHPFKNHFGENIKKERESRSLINEYTYDLDKNYRIIGSPYFKKDTNYLGHFINDGVQLKTNCRFYHLKDLHVAMIATKNIKKDEEFISLIIPNK